MMLALAKELGNDLPAKDKEWERLPHRLTGSPQMLERENGIPSQIK